MTTLIIAYFAVGISSNQSSWFLPPKAYGSSTTVQVFPANSTTIPGQTLNVNVTITDVSNLTGWEFKMFFLNSILNCTSVTEGPFLKNMGSTFKVIDIVNDYNFTHGRILAACALLGINVSANGNGDLAMITFQALGEGDTVLHLQDVKLSDEKTPPGPIPSVVIDGTVHVSPSLEQVLDVYTQRGGLGLNTSSDAFAPQEVIMFNASLRYQNAAVPGVIVQFITYDPNSNPTARTAVTGQDGIATINTTIPSTPVFGNYVTVASANTHGKDYNDTVNYKIGWIINIIQTVTCNYTGGPQSLFARGTLAYVNVTLENISFNPKQLFIIVGVTDLFGATVSQQWINCTMQSGKTFMLMGFRIPQRTLPGTGQVYTGAYNNAPWSGGFSAYCPGSYIPFEITGG